MWTRPDLVASPRTAPCQPSTPGSGKPWHRHVRRDPQACVEGEVPLSYVVFPFSLYCLWSGLRAFQAHARARPHTGRLGGLLHSTLTCHPPCRAVPCHPAVQELRTKQAALRRFRNDPCCGVLLMDGSGSVGLDLSFVQHVFLMEPLADRSVEQQVGPWRRGEGRGWRGRGRAGRTARGMGRVTMQTSGTVGTGDGGPFAAGPREQGARRRGGRLRGTRSSCASRPRDPSRSWAPGAALVCAGGAPAALCPVIHKALPPPLMPLTAADSHCGR